MPPARCLDITRLTSRLGRGPLTGVDRVELAYLRHLLADEVPFFALVRTRLGYILLDRDGAAHALAGFTGARDWGRIGLIGLLSRRTPLLKRRAEADFRRFSLARCRPRRLAQMLRRHLPAGTAYLNVGHSNLTAGTLKGWRGLPGARIVAMVHDTIPLDFPDQQRAGMAEAFRRRLEQLSRHADLLLYPSAATQADAQGHLSEMGRVPPGCVAHLGVEMARPDRSAIPADLHLNSPYFMAIGTIEPRKNHALLLDVWDALGPDAPTLLIAGRRGWRNEQVFARLDAAPPSIIERADLGDAALAALLDGAAGLLFPTLAEGYGLPPLEAASLGVPVICSDLPVFREVLGNIPVYLSPVDRYQWIQTINRLTAVYEARQERSGAGACVPTWDDHFNRVLKVT